MPFSPAPAPLGKDPIVMSEYVARELRRLGAVVVTNDDSPRSRQRTVAGASVVQVTDEVILANAVSASMSVVLPALAKARGRWLYVKKIDASANAVTIDGFDAETIDGAAAVTTTTQYDHFVLFAGDSEWHRF
jgi:hypothetical protein